MEKSHTFSTLFSNFLQKDRYVWTFLFILLAFAIVRQVRYSTPTVYPDSVTYVQSFPNLLTGKTDLSRTPIYPWLIHFTEFCTGGGDNITIFKNSETLKYEIISGFRTLHFLFGIQIGVFFLALFCFYKTLCHLVPSWFAFAFLALPLADDICVWNCSILTESLAISGVMFFFCAMFSYLESPSILKAININLLTLFLIFLRPIFLFIFLMLIPFWFIRVIFPKLSESQDRIPAIVGLSLICVVGFCIEGYKFLNYRNHGMYMMTRVSNTNFIDNLINSGIIEKGTDSKIVKYIKLHTVPENAPHHYSKTLEDNPFSHEELKYFISNTIRNNFSEYLSYVFKRMIVWPKHTYGLLYLIGNIDLIFLCWVAYKKRTIPWVRLGTWVLVYGMIFLSFYAAQDEPKRLNTPIEFICVVLLARMAYDFLSLFNKNRAASFN